MKNYSTLSRRKIKAFIKITHNRIDKLKFHIDWLNEKAKDSTIDISGDMEQTQRTLDKQEDKLRRLVSELMERDML